MRKVNFQYCARCKHCSKRGDVYGSAGISTAADIRDGVYDNVCVVQTDSDGGPLNLDHEMQSYLERGIASGALLISGSMIFEWREETQSYRKFKTMTQLAEQFLWEPRQCPLFELHPKFKNWRNNQSQTNQRVESSSMEQACS